MQNNFLANGKFDHTQLLQDTDAVLCHLDQGANRPGWGRTNERQQTEMDSFQMDEYPSIFKSLSNHLLKLVQSGISLGPAHHKDNLYI